MFFSLLYVPIVVSAYHFYGLEEAAAALCLAAAAAGGWSWARERRLHTLAAPLVAFVLGSGAFFLGDFLLLKLYPLLLSIAFLAFFLYSLYRGRYPLIAWIERAKKRPLTPAEREDVVVSHRFWVAVLLLNTLIHATLVLREGTLVWAIYSFAGWYLLFGAAIALQIAYVHRRRLKQWGRNLWGYGLFGGVIVLGFLPAITAYFYRRLTGHPKPHIVFQQVAAAMFRLFFRYAPGTREVRLLGADTLCSDSPRIYVASHESWLDYPLMGSYIVDLYHLTNKSGAFVWYLRGIAVLLGVIDGGGNNTLHALLQKLRTGSNALIFPEGSRGEGDELLPFRRGAFKLSAQSGIPVVPVLISGTSRLVRKGSLDWSTQKGVVIEVEFLNEMRIEASETAEAFAERVRDVMMRRRRKNRSG